MEPSSSPDAPKPPFQYWAFISYSSKDRAWAEWLHGALENYRLPVQLVEHPTPTGEPAPKRLKPMFWDRAELTAHHDLGEIIERSLRSSRYLIVICSPNAAQSPWVEKEIRLFQQMHGPERVLSVIVGGRAGSREADNCFPLPLRDPDPKAPDARRQGDGKTNAKLMLLATMLGVSFDVLYQRERRRRTAQLMWGSLVSAALLLITGGLWFKAQTETHRSHAEQSLRNRGEYLTDMVAARRLWDQGDAAALSAIIRKYEHPNAEDPRSFEWGYWNLLSQPTPPAEITVQGAGWITVAMHPTEPRLLAVDAEKHCSVWDTSAKRELFKLAGQVKSAEFTRDGKCVVTLLAAEFDPSVARMGQESVRVWDAGDGHSIGSFDPPLLTTCIAVSAQGDAIAMGGLGGEVNVAEFPSGKGMKRLNTLRRNPSNPSQQFSSEDHGMVTEVVWREDGYFFATGHEDGSALIWSREANLQTQRYCHAELSKPHSGPVAGIAFSPDARTVVSQSCGIFDTFKNQMSNGSAIAWTAATGEPLSQWNPHGAAPFLRSGIGTNSLITGGHVFDMMSFMSGRFRPAFDDDGRLVFTTGERSVQCWDTLSGRRTGEFMRRGTPVAAVAIHQKSHVLTCINGDTMTLGSANRASARQLIRSARLVYDMRLSADGSLIAMRTEVGRGLSIGTEVTYSRSLDHVLTVLRVSDGKEIKPEEAIIKSAGTPWFGPNGESAGLGTKRFAIKTGVPLPDLDGASRTSDRSVFVSHDGLMALTVSAKNAEVVQLQTDAVTAWQHVPQQGGRVAVFDPANQRVALGFASGAVEVRNAQSGAVEVQFGTAVGQLTALAFGKDGKSLAVGGMDRSIQIWDLQARLLRFTLAGHRREISSLAFSPDGKILVSASGLAEIDSPEAGEVRLWDARDGQLRTEFPSDRHEIYTGVAFSPDGNHLFAAACDTRAQPDHVLTAFSRGGQRLLPPTLPEPIVSSRIIVWDAVPPKPAP